MALSTAHILWVSMDERRCEIVLPELGLGEVAVSLWLVRPGKEVAEGDRVLEVVAGEVTIDLPAPASGILTETLVAEDETVSTGQVLAIIRTPG